MDYIDLLMNKDCNIQDVIRLFYLSYDDDILSTHSEEEFLKISGKLLTILQKYDIDKLIDTLDDGTNMLPLINAANIPQFSDINAIEPLLPYVKANAGEKCTYALIGYFFYKDSKVGAQTKYGENHYKTAMLMGLTKKNKPFDVTPLGRLYMELPIPVVKKIKPLLYLRIPLIRHIMVKARNESVNVSEIMALSLSESTVKRRLSNVKTMVEALVSLSGNKVSYDININWM
ncbi:hypothetical protein [uncultured Phascolarctobacterium sp.]|uniref:hypothetical protein n=1 Tax=uncultured Phascolarctobacterium sp. TaxID=512296 RepID=UPI0025CDEDE2|nr:hypothetical protein [uncultured Phascolarctobacterium sp.]